MRLDRVEYQARAVVEKRGKFFLIVVFYCAKPVKYGTVIGKFLEFGEFFGIFAVALPYRFVKKRSKLRI